ncbi:MAG: Uma2 family endonuclease [Isosphaeraceae bacterium]
MSTAQAQPQGRVKWTVADFARIQDAGLFDGRHIELLDGELYEVTKLPPHDFTVGALAGDLRALLPRNQYTVREEKSTEPWENWWPEPDVSVARGPQRRYAHRRPGPGDLAMVAEVSYSSDQDWTKKLPGYAAAGIPIYWIVDLVHRRLEIHRDPGPAGYAVSEIVAEGEQVELVIDNQSFGWIAVSDFLP